MKNVILLLFVTAFITGTALNAQPTFTVTESGDTINLTDDNGLKQGFWETKVRNITSRGNYMDDLKEGTWTNYHPRGFLSKLENYVHGKKNGIFITIE